MSNGGTNDASMRSGLRFLMLGPVEARFDGRLVEIERPLYITGVTTGGPAKITWEG
jgi:hypothetical protein